MTIPLQAGHTYRPRRRQTVAAIATGALISAIILTPVFLAIHSIPGF